MTVNVLLVEDSPGDARLTNEAFREVNHDVRMWAAFDGAEAMAFLRREREHATAPRPDLILLDLNMPKLDGREVLAQIKADESLKPIPTVVLTTSTAAVDVAISYQLQANCFLNKPIDMFVFEGLIKSINDFWLTKATLPGSHPPK